MNDHHNKSLEPANSKSAPAKELLAGWGNVNPRQAMLLPVFNTANLTRAVSSSEQVGGTIARGLGRSYGDSAVNYEGFVLSQISRNRMLRFDSEAGLLTCEAGVSLADIIQCLLPRGWFLPTTPGTKFVTVGGAIAADVHGKNHHVDGSWGTFVTRFSLLTASGEIVECSREENSKLFRATLGGMGLTGIVIDATIQLTKVTTAFVNR
ncbi:MAG: FAD-binding oxidoreductase, partial [Planctomycetaceae bacterium]|nr:FAD-binding oxidoreductase [Planctomycetaceae bacterium]